MAAPRDLQPHLSAAVNQAIMRGMAVEVRYRPATMAEWLALLPSDWVPSAPLPRSTLTQTSATVRLPQQRPRPVAVASASSPTAANRPPAKRQLTPGLLGAAVFTFAFIATSAFFAISHSSPPRPKSPVVQPSSQVPTDVDKKEVTSPQPQVTETPVQIPTTTPSPRSNSHPEVESPSPSPSDSPSPRLGSPLSTPRASQPPALPPDSTQASPSVIPTQSSSPAVTPQPESPAKEQQSSKDNSGQHSSKLDKNKREEKHQ